jgi:hypothetical protein
VGHRGGVITDPTASLTMNARSALRVVMQRAPGVRAQLDPGTPLERLPSDAERPRIVAAQVVEDSVEPARRVPGAPVVGFAAFLDGTQTSEVIAWDGAAPIVVGRVAAVVRIRVARRLATWRRPLVSRRIYAPFAYTARAPWDEVVPAASLVDTAPPDDAGVVPPPHPILLLDCARRAVQAAREQAERVLAEAWCDAERRPLFVDGSISGSEAVARATCAVGVIKSHNTLYANGEAPGAALTLRVGERSAVFRIAPRGRSSVYSWYLRLRDPLGHDALWGLVRVEVAETDAISERADEVSRWVLAEAAPSAMPDARWDKMAYGVRDCETFLRAIS